MSYDDDLAVVNGHSYKERKSGNTNLAILCSQEFAPPFDQPIGYAKKVGELTNMLGDGHILVQRYGDILAGKRTWPEELSRSNVRPTLPDAVDEIVTGSSRRMRPASSASIISSSVMILVTLAG